MLFILAALFVASPLQRFSRCRSHRSSRLVPLFDAPQRARVVVTVVVKCRSLRPVVDVAKEYQRGAKAIWCGSFSETTTTTTTTTTKTRVVVRGVFFFSASIRASQNALVCKTKTEGKREENYVSLIKRRGCFIQFCSSFFLLCFLGSYTD